MSKKKWDKKKVIEEIKRLKRSGNALKSSDVIKADYALFRAANRHFGSWASAVTASGYNYEKIKRSDYFWSQKNLKKLEELCDRDYSLDKIADYFNLSKPQIKYAKKKFKIKSPTDQSRKKAKTWTKKEIEYLKKHTSITASLIAKKLQRTRAAVLQKRKSLGIDPDIPKKWSKELVLKKITERYKSKKPLQAGYINTNEKSLFRAATRLFGSWSDAVKATGIDYEGEIRIFEYWDKAKIVNEIKKLHRKGVDLGSHSIQGTHRALYVAACKHIGSWDKAMKAAKVDYSKYLRMAQPKPISKKGIIEQIQKWNDAGEPLNADYMGQKYPNFEAQARRKFGSWKDALESAGLDYEDIKLINTDRIECGLKLEKLLKRYFKIYYPHYESHPRLEKNGRNCFIPDFYDRKNNIWIDCKLTCWSLTTKETIIKYGQFASEVHIYYLLGRKPKALENVKYYNIEQLFLKQNNKKFIDELSELKRIIEVSC